MRLLIPPPIHTPIPAEHENVHTSLINLRFCWEIWGLGKHPDSRFSLLQFAGDKSSFSRGASTLLPRGALLRSGLWGPSTLSRPAQQAHSQRSRPFSLRSRSRLLGCHFQLPPQPCVEDLWTFALRFIIPRVQLTETAPPSALQPRTSSRRLSAEVGQFSPLRKLRV